MQEDISESSDEYDEQNLSTRFWHGLQKIGPKTRFEMNWLLGHEHIHNMVKVD